MKFFNLFLSVIIFTGISYAQTRTNTYDWEKSPVPYKDDSLQHEGLIYKIVDYTIHEIALTEDGKAEFYQTVHVRSKILTEGGIEVFNKMEVPLYNVNEIVRFKARTIQPDGTVSNLPTNAIKHVDNYNESGVDYKIFVYEGLKIGSEIEYIYTFKKEPIINGYSYLQWNVDSKLEGFEMVYPAYLDFRVKTYGQGIVEKKDSAGYGKNVFIVRTFTNENSKAIKSEPYSNWKSYLARIDYVLDKNARTEKYEMNTYKILAQNYYANLYPDEKSPNKKAINLVKKISTNPSDKLQVAKDIENYVKLNFKSADSPSDKNINRIIGSLSGSSLDKYTAFIELYRAAGFKVELVFTSENTSKKFDPSFESPSNCGLFLIYLPEIGYFMSPDNIILKSGYFDTEAFEQKGMFIKQVCVGDFCSGVSYIGSITSKKAEESIHDMVLDITIDHDFSSAIIKFNNSMTGYHASSYQPIFSFLEEENKNELKKSLVENFAGEYKVADIQVENGTYEDAFNKPFILKGMVETETLLEHAGDKYLFKVGHVLGEQYEMYDKTKRQLPVENDFNRIYSRTITVNIPDGYEISNMSDFQDKQIKCDYNGKDAAGINFTYKLEGSVLTITINEYYNILNLPLEEYDEYRNVINGAADFNKKVIIFSQKK